MGIIFTGDDSIKTESQAKSFFRNKNIYLRFFLKLVDDEYLNQINEFGGDSDIQYTFSYLLSSDWTSYFSNETQDTFLVLIKDLDSENYLRGFDDYREWEGERI